MRVTVLGLGGMGAALARRLLDTGHRVTVWNRSHGRATPVVERGAAEAPSVAAAVADAEAAIVMVSDDAAAAAVTSGPDGALAHLPAAAVLLGASTVSPQLSRRFGDEAGPARYLETPVMGSPEATAAGEATILVGGEAATAARMKGLLDDLCVTHVLVGPAGTATALKLATNAIMIGSLSVLAEAVAVARSGGVPAALLDGFLAESPLVAPALRRRLDAVLHGTDPDAFSIALARKDVGLARAVAEDAGLPLPVTDAVHALLARGTEAGLDDRDLALLARLLTPSVVVAG